jgi:hypothetical protein
VVKAAQSMDGMARSLQGVVGSFTLNTNASNVVAFQKQNDDQGSDLESEAA